MYINQQESVNANKNVDIKFSAHDAFSGINFIRYAPNHLRNIANSVNSCHKMLTPIIFLYFGSLINKFNSLPGYFYKPLL